MVTSSIEDPSQMRPGHLDTHPATVRGTTDQGGRLSMRQASCYIPRIINYIDLTPAVDPVAL